MMDEARSVPIARRLRKELDGSLGTMPKPEPSRPLFTSRKGGRFGAYGVVLPLNRISPGRVSPEPAAKGRQRE